jgi:Protein of unknown function (DUF3626)
MPDTARLRLTSAQLAALRHVDGLTAACVDSARSRIAQTLVRAGVMAHVYANAMQTVQQHARVVVHFHPDRFSTRRGVTVIEGLLADGIYRNQFDTGLSSGSTSAFAGGARDSWERTLFGGAYHAEGVQDSERPKYGTLELVRFADGPIPRFGSCYFVLKQQVSWRTTFTFMGSEDPLAPSRVGTIDQMDCVMAPLLEEIERGGFTAPPWPPFVAPTLGLEAATVQGFFAVIDQLAESRDNPSTAQPGRVLDTQIEAQIHGVIELSQHVELLVADPAFRTTSTGNALRDLELKYQIPLRWHRGFRLHVKDVRDDFRGPAVARLARRIAGENGMLDAVAIGTAEKSLHTDPQQWTDYGDQDPALEHFKQVWHVLVHFGSTS